ANRRCTAGVFPQRFLGSYQPAYGRPRCRRMRLDQTLSGDQPREGAVPTCGRPVATTSAENDRTDTASNPDLGAHPAGPESIQRTGCECLGRGDAERWAGRVRAGHRSNMDILNARLAKQSMESSVGPRSGADPKPAEERQIAAIRLKI